MAFAQLEQEEFQLRYYSILAFSLHLPIVQYLYGRDWMILDVV